MEQSVATVLNLICDRTPVGVGRRTPSERCGLVGDVGCTDAAGNRGGDVRRLRCRNKIVFHQPIALAAIVVKSADPHVVGRVGLQANDPRRRGGRLRPSSPPKDRQRLVLDLVSDRIPVGVGRRAPSERCGVVGDVSCCQVARNSWGGVQLLRHERLVPDHPVAFAARAIHGP